MEKAGGRAPAGHPLLLDPLEDDHAQYPRLYDGAQGAQHATGLAQGAEHHPRDAGPRRARGPAGPECGAAHRHPRPHGGLGPCGEAFLGGQEVERLVQEEGHRNSASGGQAEHVDVVSRPLLPSSFRAHERMREMFRYNTLMKGYAQQGDLGKMEQARSCE